MMISALDMVENIVGKRKKKCWLPAFSLFPTIFSKTSFFNSIPNNKVLPWSKLKAFACKNSNVPEMIISVIE